MNYYSKEDCQIEDFEALIDRQLSLGHQSQAVEVHHNVPFYIAMPTTTLDRETPTGNEIIIEERDPTEVRSVQGKAIAPYDIPVWNPSFDVTDAEYITAWVTEYGVWTLPFPSEPTL